MAIPDIFHSAMEVLYETAPTPSTPQPSSPTVAERLVPCIDGVGDHPWSYPLEPLPFVEPQRAPATPSPDVFPYSPVHEDEPNFYDLEGRNEHNENEDLLEAPVADPYVGFVDDALPGRLTPSTPQFAPASPAQQPSAPAEGPTLTRLEAPSLSSATVLMRTPDTRFCPFSWLRRDGSCGDFDGDDLADEQAEDEEGPDEEDEEEHVIRRSVSEPISSSPQPSSASFVEDVASLRDQLMDEPEPAESEDENNQRILALLEPIAQEATPQHVVVPEVELCWPKPSRCPPWRPSNLAMASGIADSKTVRGIGCHVIYSRTDRGDTPIDARGQVPLQQVAPPHSKRMPMNSAPRPAVSCPAKACPYPLKRKVFVPSVLIL
jgi:hypothetical protein